MTHVLHRFLVKLQVRRVAVSYVLILLIVAVVGNAATFYAFDGRAQGFGFGDALWYSLISITTIGYGDYSAQSTGARLGTILFIIVIGMGAFTFLLGTALDFLVEHRVHLLQGKGRMNLSNHLVIVNFPGAVYVRQIIDEWRADPGHADQPIVLVNDQINELPFELPYLYFVKGSPLEAEVYTRAALGAAALVIVLATGADDPNSDAVVASAVSVIEHVRPGVRAVAECQSDRHLSLFASVHCNSVVPSQQIGNNLLVQESQDAGASGVLAKLLSNQHPETLYTTPVGDAADIATYREAAVLLVGNKALPVGLLRAGETITDFLDTSVQAGDCLIYIAPSRMTWAELIVAR